MVFAEEVVRCPCGGRRSVAAFVADATRARSLLVTLGRPAEPATFAPERYRAAAVDSRVALTQDQLHGGSWRRRRV